MKYVIRKSSRSYTSGIGYDGVTCDSAKVPRGKIYESLKEAEKDAKLMSQCNPVGFVVEEYKEMPA